MQFPIFVETVQQTLKFATYIRATSTNNGCNMSDDAFGSTAFYFINSDFMYLYQMKHLLRSQSFANFEFISECVKIEKMFIYDSSSERVAISSHDLDHRRCYQLQNFPLFFVIKFNKIKKNTINHRHSIVYLVLKHSEEISKHKNEIELSHRLIEAFV